MVLKDDERWVHTKPLCNGWASYNGPCGDPGCSDCYPGGLICRLCSDLKGECECDNCEECGKNWKEDYSQYCVCPFCSCIHCGEIERECNCENGFTADEHIQTDEEWKQTLKEIK